MTVYAKHVQGKYTKLVFTDIYADKECKERLTTFGRKLNRNTKYLPAGWTTASVVWL